MTDMSTFAGDPASSLGIDSIPKIVEVDEPALHFRNEIPSGLRLNEAKALLSRQSPVSGSNKVRGREMGG